MRPFDISKMVSDEHSSSRKYRLELLIDHTFIELASFEHNNDAYLCISTQVGCPIGCPLCSTTYSDPQFIRNMSFDELLNISNYFIDKVKGYNKPIIITFSGHGEPLLNWKNVREVINIISPLVHRVDVTTTGITNTFKEILSENRNDINFYISLHGATDIKRSKYVRYRQGMAKLNDIIEFINSYKKLGGKIVINYAATSTNIDNASISELVGFLNSIEYPVEVRISEYMEIKHETGFHKPIEAEFARFFQEIKHNYPNGSVRRSNLEGENMGIACGQLRGGTMQ